MSDRLYADLKPTDIIEEGFVHDIAYWMWELWRWRRIKIWLIDAKRFDAFAWAFSLRPNKRLEYIGQTDEIEIINEPISEEKKKKLEAIEAGTAEVLRQLGEEERTNEADFLAEFASSSNAATTRVFLEQFEYVERIDQRIVIAERSRNAVYRVDRHRASVWREKIRNIEETEFKDIKLEKLRANGGKSAA
jgi:hypothetical protein